MSKLVRLIIFTLTTLLVIFGAHSATTALVYRDAGEETAKSAYRINEADLRNRINGILQANRDLDISVSITDLQTGQRYHYGETASYTAASVTKLITAAAYLQKVEVGQARLSDRVGNADAQQQLSLLIGKSDNTAWHELNGIITPDGLAAYARTVGLTSYNPGNNVVTSDDIALFLSKLASQQLLDGRHTDFLLSLMAQANYRSYIVAAVPPGVMVYHKVGFLDDRLHEAALIKKGDRSFVLTVFSKSNNPYPFTRGAEVFKTVTKETLAVFFQ